MSTRPAIAILRQPTKGPYAEMAAAGSAQASAAEMTADTVMVSSGSGGVILPAMNVNEECIVCNGLTDTIEVYPRTGGKINNGTANASLTLTGNRAARFRAIDGGGNVMAFF